MFIRALQGHTGKNLDISTFFSQKDSEGTRAIQVSCCFLKIRRFQNNLQKPVPGGFGTSNVLLSRVAMGSKPRPEVRAQLPLEEPSWPIVGDRSGSGAESAGIFTKQRTGVSCATTQFRPSSSLRSSTSKSDENGSGKKNQKKKNCHQRKEVDATKVSRGKLHGMK